MNLAMEFYLMHRCISAWIYFYLSMIKCCKFLEETYLFVSMHVFTGSTNGPTHQWMQIRGNGILPSRPEIVIMKEDLLPM